MRAAVNHEWFNRNSDAVASAGRRDHLSFRRGYSISEAAEHIGSRSTDSYRDRGSPSRSAITSGKRCGRAD